MIRYSALFNGLPFWVLVNSGFPVRSTSLTALYMFEATWPCCHILALLRFCTRQLCSFEAAEQELLPRSRQPKLDGEFEVLREFFIWILTSAPKSAATDATTKGIWKEPVLSPTHPANGGPRS